MKSAVIVRFWHQLSYKPTSQTEKWYGRRERRDNKSNAEAVIKKSWAGPKHRDDWQNEHGLDNANALPSIEDVGNHRPSQGKQQNIWDGHHHHGKPHRRP